MTSVKSIFYKGNFMSQQVFARIFYHFVWSTKNRMPFIQKEFRQNLWLYIAQIAEQNRWNIISVGGTANHVHILFQSTSLECVSNVVRFFKSHSSRFVRKNFSENFEWQNGYSVFSVDFRTIPKIKKYIENQEQHHQSMLFESELKKIIEAYE